MSAATTALTSNGTNSSAGEPWPATRVGGAAGWRCCSTAGSRPGWVPGDRCPLPRRTVPPQSRRIVPRTVWCTRWPAWRSVRWPAGETR
jgi:hypothetical protein